MGLPAHDRLAGLLRRGDLLQTCDICAKPRPVVLAVRRFGMVLA
jgi:hypothetical protein